jgi:hypothetical protein
VCICATGPSLAILLRLQVFKWPKTATVTYGNKTKGKASHVFSDVDLGEVLGETSIADDCLHTIFRSSAFHCAVHNREGMTGDRCRMQSQRKEIVNVPISQDDDLYSIHIQDCLQHAASPSVTS